MEFSPLTAVSPIDGRYRPKTEKLTPYFSEYALIRYRVLVEVEYFIALCELDLPQLEKFDKSLFPQLQLIYADFTIEDALRIKEIEQTTNHDVKAVEYFLKERFKALKLSQYSEFIHFGLTSQDINNTSIPLSFKDAIWRAYYPAYEKVYKKLQELAREWANIPMLAFTHGQPASPTTLGKELQVFVYRLRQQEMLLETSTFKAKFGGATGNFNAHKVAYPNINWLEFADEFVESIGLERSQFTTQIENYDALASVCDNLRRINTILLDLAKDMWTYISMNYFTQKIKKNEVGSSAMPHKVNPIDFENAEGNLGIANALFGHFAEKLPISRLQRDLTDSTVLRNLGVPIGHTLIALDSLFKGLEKIQLNEAKIKADLQDNWAVVAEAIQTILRRENYPNPYESLKELTRNNEKITSETIQNFIQNLTISQSLKEELKAITPFNYIGVNPNF